MRIITLNAWGARIRDKFFEFVKDNSASTDIFCFQEIYNGHEKIDSEKNVTSNLLNELSELLPGFNYYFAESDTIPLAGESVPYGICIFAKKNLKPQVYVLHELFGLNQDIGLGTENYNRLLQQLTVTYNGEIFTVFNLHGLYAGGQKNDLPARIVQSQKIKEILEQVDGEKILCGDFNLNPETTSLSMLKENMTEWVLKSGAQTTRSRLCAPGKGLFADYMLTTPGIRVKKFEVMKDEVSDHLPLAIEI